MKTFFKIISLIFQPFLVPTYGMTMLMSMDLFSVMALKWRIVAVIGTFFCTGILPVVPIWLMIRRGEVKNLFMSDRTERTTPYLFSLMAYIFWSLFMIQTLRFPMFIASVGIGSAISILLIILINFKWKISAHLSAMGGITAAIFAICFRMAINPVWLFTLVFGISALVALSRIELKEHTPAQTFAGFMLGFFSVFIACIFI